MAIYILCEIKCDGSVLDMVAFPTSEALLDYAEPTDIEDKVYQVFDSVGCWFDFDRSADARTYSLLPIKNDLEKARSYLMRFLNSTKLGFDPGATLDANASKLI